MQSVTPKRVRLNRAGGQPQPERAKASLAPAMRSGERGQREVQSRERSLRAAALKGLPSVDDAGTAYLRAMVMA
ncbi:MAG: hypothetical protein CL936_16200 [Deltaproteobacteria bacterium]|nr:hypothetical protein [Deltaproteobacteria bacterium]